MTKKNLLHIICVLAFSHLLYSQNMDPEKLPRQWSLQQCIAFARQNNIQIQSLRLSSDAALQDQMQAENNRLPNLAGSLTQSWVHRQDAGSVINGSQTLTGLSSNYGVNSSTVLYNGGYLKNTIKVNQLLVQSANLTVEEVTNDITLSITQAFLNILLVKENIKVFEELLATSEAQLKQGQQRYQAGSISKKDLLQLESQLASDNYNLVNARNTYRLNMVALKQLLQLPTAYDMTIEVPELIEPEEAVLALPTVQTTALDTRAEVKNKEAGLRLAEVEQQLVKAGRLPLISVNGGLYSGYSNRQYSKYFSQLNNNFYQTFSIGASTPIFSRRQNKTNMIKSEIAIKQAALALQDTRITLTQQVEKAYINVLNAQAQYKAAEAQLKSAEEIYKITEEQLKWGAINMVEVLLQKNTYVQALQAYIQSKYTAVLYNKIYQFYTGAPITF